MKWSVAHCVSLAGILGTMACRQAGESPAPAISESGSRPAAQAGSPALPRGWDPCALALAPHKGTNRIDLEIARFQEMARKSTNASPALDRLGWLFVAKARESFDPGFYNFAERCALCLESRQPGAPEALLLRAHVLQNQHRFKEAEPLARELVAKRGLPFDHAVLGDVLLELGRVDEAVEHYQRMMDLKPDAQAYVRGAQIRWLKGDPEGALELMRGAASAASPHDPESAAWIWTRLGQLQFQTGGKAQARISAEAARQFHKDYPPALLLLGRMELAEGNAASAVRLLQNAAQKNPLPEYQWVLADALREANRAEEAAQVEVELRRSGASRDPRTTALFLATRDGVPKVSLNLAQKELSEREDVFTHDALAWALAGNGQFEEAHQRMQQALAQGTQDARLFFHAAVIAAKSGRAEEAENWFERATTLIHLLLPSEAERLLDLVDNFPTAGPDQPSTLSAAAP